MQQHDQHQLESVLLEYSRCRNQVIPAFNKHVQSLSSVPTAEMSLNLVMAKTFSLPHEQYQYHLPSNNEVGVPAVYMQRTDSSGTSYIGYRICLALFGKKRGKARGLSSGNTNYPMCNYVTAPATMVTTSSVANHASDSLQISVCMSASIRRLS